MANDNGRQDYRIVLDNSALNISATEARNILHNIGSTATKESATMDNALLKVGKTLGVVFAAGQLKAFASQVVSLRSEIQSLEISFQTLAGKTKGDALFQSLREFAVKTPMMLKDLAQGAQTMLAFNIEAEKVMPILQAIGDVSMGDAQKFNSLTLAFSQMSATGKLMGQDLLQMINAGFNPLAVISEKTGKSIGELKEQMEGGKISVQMVTDAFIAATSEGGKFNGMLEKQSQGLQGAISNLQGAIDDMMNEIGTATEGATVSAIHAVTELVKNYEHVGRVLAGIIATYGVYRAALIAVTAASGWATAAEAIHYNWLLLVEKAQKMLNATMLANPYVLVATLIAGVVAAMVSMKTEAERLKEAEEDYEAQKQKVIEKEQQHKQEIEQLCSIAADEAVATDTRRDALFQLEKKYPDIFAKYDTEYEKLSNIKKIKEEIAELDGKKSITKTRNELENVDQRIKALEAKKATLREEWEDANGSGTKMRKKTVGGLTRDEEIELKMLMGKRRELSEKARKDDVDAYFVNLTGVSNEDLSRMIATRKTLLAKIAMEEQNGKSNINGRIAGEGATLNGVYSKEELQAQLQALQRQQNYRDADTKSGAQWLAEKRKTYESALAAYNNYVNGVTSKGVKQEDFAKEAARLKAEMETAKKEYEKIKPATDNDSKSAAKKAEEQRKKDNNITVENAKRLRAIEEAKEAEIRVTRDAMLQVEQEKLNLQKDSVDKQLAQIEIDKKRMEYAIADREAELLKKYRDIKEKQWENENPNAKDKGIAFDPTSITAEDMKAAAKAPNMGWLAEALNAITASRKIMTETAQKRERDAMDSMLAEILTYEQQRLKITEEYTRKRNDLYAKDKDGNIKTDANGNKVFRKGASQGNIDELDRRRDEALKGIDELFASREASYEGWCNSIANLSIANLEQVLKRAKLALTELEADPNANPQQLAVARAKVNTAQKKLNSAKSDESLNPGKRTIKEWQDLYKTLNDVKKSFDEIGDAVGGVVGDIISAAGDIATSTLSMINGMVQLAQWSTISTKMTAEGVSAAIQTVEKASVILTIISAAMQIAMQIINLFNDDDKKQKEIEHLQDRIDTLQWELDHAEIGRIQSEYGSSFDLVRNSIAATRQELIASNAATNSWWQNFRLRFTSASRNADLLKGSIEKIADAYSNMKYTADKALGSTKYDEARAQLENIAQQQILITEQISSEKSKKKTDWGQIEQWQQQIEELGQQAVAIINELTEGIIGNTASDLAQELSDAFFEAFENGENYAEAWGVKVKEIVGDIMKRMLVQKVLEERLGEVFDKYKAIWFRNGTFQGFDAVTNSMAQFGADLNAVGNEWITIWEAMPDHLKNMFVKSEDTSREASQKGIAQASQDSVDELNGRTTAIQGHTYSIAENFKMMIDISNRILNAVINIESETKGLGERMSKIEGYTKDTKDGIDELVTKGVKIKDY